MELSGVSFAIGCCDFIFGQLSCACSVLTLRAASNPLSSSCSSTLVLFIFLVSRVWIINWQKKFLLCLCNEAPHFLISLSWLSHPRIPFSSPLFSHLPCHFLFSQLLCQRDSRHFKILLSSDVTACGKHCPDSAMNLRTHYCSLTLPAFTSRPCLA